MFYLFKKGINDSLKFLLNFKRTKVNAMKSLIVYKVKSFSKLKRAIITFSNTSKTENSHTDGDVESSTKDIDVRTVVKDIQRIISREHIKILASRYQAARIS